MLPVLTLGREGGGAEVAQELNNLEERKSHETTKIKKSFFVKGVMWWYVHLSVFFHVFFKVSRMPELPVAVRASEPVRGSD